MSESPSLSLRGISQVVGTDMNTNKHSDYGKQSNRAMHLVQKQQRQILFRDFHSVAISNCF